MFKDDWYPVYGSFPTNTDFEWMGKDVEISYEEFLTLQLHDNLRTQANDYLKTLYEREDSQENS